MANSSNENVTKERIEPIVGPEEAALNAPDDLVPFGDAPDGGLRAWLVAAGAACIFFASLGLGNAFGVFQEYYLTHQLKDRSADDVAWIGSLAAFLQFTSGALGGPLFDRYGAWIIRPAAFLYIFSIMMTSLCTEYWQFILAQAILPGLSAGLLQFPAMAAVSQFFDKKRAAALGITISGSSIGGVIIPIALSKMLNDSSLSFGWSVRIIGFLLVPLLAFSCVTIKSRLPPRKTNFFILSAFRKPTYVLLIIALFFMLLGMFTPLFFIPTYAVSRGIDPTLASYLLAIVNAASTFGRVVPGIIADRFGRLNIFMLGAIFTGIVVLLLTLAQNTAGLIVYSIAIGFTSGTIVSGGSASFTVCPDDPREMGSYLGMGFAISSIAALIGPPANGALLVRYGGFLQVSIFSGVMCLVGAVIVAVSKTYTKQGLMGRV